MTTATAASAADPVAPTGLGWAGRIVVAVSFVAGCVVGLPSGIGVLWFAAFAGVGSMLAIRRPRTSIGWLLILLGWAFVLAATTIDATASDFETGSLPLPTLVLAWLSAQSGTLTYFLLSILAIVFPSGRLPEGRYRPVAQAAVGLGLVLLIAGALSPRMLVSLSGAQESDGVPNPLAVFPDSPIWKILSPDILFVPLGLLLVASVVSLVIRFRRAHGVERQQLRWFGAALVFVVVGIVFGLVTSTVIPGASDSSYPWAVAVLAFPTVALAIGVAVLRYRLYNIDTIINRAIVYGLLTAILAGGSAAVIGVAQRLFQGVLGEGSDATVVVTTLLVVTAFNPVKNRLQSIVDSRFKAIHDPAIDLPAFVDGVRASVASPDRERTLRRLLEVAVLAYGAKGGQITIEDSREKAILEVGTVAGTSAAVGAVAGSLRVRVTLSGTDASRRIAPLQEALLAIVGDLTGLEAVSVEEAVAPTGAPAATDEATLRVAVGG